jgi:hypothetical protein
VDAVATHMFGQLGRIVHHAHPPYPRNFTALLLMTTVTGVPPFHSAGTHAERHSSTAAAAEGA